MTETKKRQAKSFGRRIKKCLLDEELTVTALARRVGFNRSTVSKAINQGRHPRCLEKISEQLGLR